MTCGETCDQEVINNHDEENKKDKNTASQYFRKPWLILNERGRLKDEGAARVQNWSTNHS